MEQMTERRAAGMLAEGYHCSQVVALHIAECMGLDKAEAMRLTAGLGAGCNHGDTCGAVSAGVLALGRVYGFDTYEKEKDTILKDKVREFQAKFIALHGASLCRELLDHYDAADPDRVSTETTWDNCGGYCADACAILDEMIGVFYRKQEDKA